MGDERRNQLMDEYEEAALNLLMDDFAEADGECLWQEFESAQEKGEVPDVPDELDAKCKELIRSSYSKHNRRRILKRIGNAAGRVAVVGFICMGLATTLVLSVEALRIPVLNFFLGYSDRCAIIDFALPENAVVSNKEVVAHISSVPPPDGYQFEEYSEAEDGAIMICYKNAAQDLIVLNILPTNGQFLFDTEDSNFTPLEIYDHEAYFIEKDGYRVIWMDAEEKLAFDLYADNADIDSFWRFAYQIAE